VCHAQLRLEGDIAGAYIYGLKRLVMMPVEKRDMVLTLVCDFNHGDDERADCKLVTEASSHVCAEMHLTLEHRDTHHTRHRGSDHHHHDDHGEDHRGELVEHHYDIEGHDHAEHFDKEHRHIDHPDDDHYVV